MATQTVFNFPSKMTHTFEFRYPRIQLETTPGFQFDASLVTLGKSKYQAYSAPPDHFIQDSAICSYWKFYKLIVEEKKIKLKGSNPFL